MSSEEQKKLCWECGGEVPFESEQCPFCGAEFETEALSDSAVPPAGTHASESSSESLESSYSDVEAHSSSLYDSSEQPDLFSQQNPSPPKPLYEPVSSDLYSGRSTEESENALFHSNAEEYKARMEASGQRPKNPVEEKESAASKTQMLSLCLIVPGLSLLLFGVGMILFSEEGQLTLRWDASYGLFIFTLSALFIYFGARAFRKIDK